MGNELRHAPGARDLVDEQRLERPWSGHRRLRSGSRRRRRERSLTARSLEHRRRLLVVLPGDGHHAIITVCDRRGPIPGFTVSSLCASAHRAKRAWFRVSDVSGTIFAEIHVAADTHVSRLRSEGILPIRSLIAWNLGFLGLPLCSAALSRFSRSPRSLLGKIAKR